MGFWKYVFNNMGIAKQADNEGNKPVNNAKEPVERVDKWRTDDSVAIINPQEFQDVVDLVDYIAKGRTAVVDFHNLATNIAERSIDFLSGAIFALGGDMQEVSRGLYLYAPSGVKLIKPKRKI